MKTFHTLHRDYDKAWRDKGCFVIEVKGYDVDENAFVYNNGERVPEWWVIDKETGMSITNAKRTKKEALAQYEERKEAYHKVKNDNRDYIQKCKSIFKELLAAL